MISHIALSACAWNVIIKRLPSMTHWITQFASLSTFIFARFVWNANTRTTLMGSAFEDNNFFLLHSDVDEPSNTVLVGVILFIYFFFLAKWRHCSLCDGFRIKKFFFSFFLFFYFKSLILYFWYTFKYIYLYMRLSVSRNLLLMRQNVSVYFFCAF